MNFYGFSGDFYANLHKMIVQSLLTASLAHP